MYPKLHRQTELLVLRKVGIYGKMFCISQGEDLHAAVVREVKEETGVSHDQTYIHVCLVSCTKCDYHTKAGRSCCV